MYGVFFVNPASDLYSTSVPILFYVISFNIRRVLTALGTALDCIDNLYTAQCCMHNDRPCNRTTFVSPTSESFLRF